MAFLDFQLVLGRHNIRPPHFASKVSYSASPQTFAACSRSAPEGGNPHTIVCCGARFSLRVRGPHFASKVSYNAGAADFRYVTVALTLRAK